MITSVVSSSNATTRLILWGGLLFIEASLVTRIVVVSLEHKQSYDTHPALQLEMATIVREHPLLQVAAIAFLGLFVIANVALIILIWRLFASGNIGPDSLVRGLVGGDADAKIVHKSLCNVPVVRHRIYSVFTVGLLGLFLAIGQQ